MAEENATSGIKTSLTNWIKAGVTSVVGLVSGACLMYLTPIINSTIKPAQPIANFSTQITGLTVNFTNRSSGGVSGWWDFGDGSALEPFSAKQTILTHTYDRPGTYSVKLSLQNLLQEQSDRTVSVTADSSTAAKPEIESFDVTPVTPSERAPAIYRLKCKVKNASLSILSSGDERPLQLDAASTNIERYFSFDEMGTYTIRLAAVSGKEIVEKLKTVYVSPSEGLEPLAKLVVSYQAVRVESAEKTFRILCSWHGDTNESCSAVHAERLAYPGFQFTSATIVNKDEEQAPVRNLKCEIAPDKSRLSFTGELVKPTSILESSKLPRWVAVVKGTMQRRSAPVLVKRDDVMMSVHLNSTVKIPMQPLDDGWEAVSTQATLELWDGPRKVWASDKAVTSAKTVLKNQQCFITMMPQTDGMLLKIDAPAASPVTFQPPPSIAPPPLTFQPPPKLVPPPPVTFQPPPREVRPSPVPVVARPTSLQRLPSLLTRPTKD